ncbi:MAG TPA: four helix bundle protein [Bacteroidia bacterium]
MSDKEEFIEALKKRTKSLALEVIKLSRTLPVTDEAKVIGRQLLRSSSSVAANYRAVCRARSKAEFFAKLSITVEEADETCLWLELLIESGIAHNKTTGELLKEAGELTKILARARKNT